MTKFNPPRPITKEWLEKAYLQGLVPKASFIDGAYYKGSCRNASIAKWDAKKNRFVYVRTKFGARFIDEIECAEDDLGYDIFLPTQQSKPTEDQSVWETIHKENT